MNSFAILVVVAILATVDTATRFRSAGSPFQPGGVSYTGGSRGAGSPFQPAGGSYTGGSRGAGSPPQRGVSSYPVDPMKTAAKVVSSFSKAVQASAVGLLKDGKMPSDLVNKKGLDQNQVAAPGPRTRPDIKSLDHVPGPIKSPFDKNVDQNQVAAPGPRTRPDIKSLDHVPGPIKSPFDKNVDQNLVAPPRVRTRPDIKSLDPEPDPIKSPADNKDPMKMAEEAVSSFSSAAQASAAVLLKDKKMPSDFVNNEELHLKPVDQKLESQKSPIEHKPRPDIVQDIKVKEPPKTDTKTAKLPTVNNGRFNNVENPVDDERILPKGSGRGSSYTLNQNYNGLTGATQRPIYVLGPDNDGIRSYNGNFNNGCDPGVRFIKCPVDPCGVSSCPGVPGAVCRENHCGRCSAFWFNGHEEVTSRCNTTPATGG